MDRWLSRAAAAHPERVAVVAAGGQLTYAELQARASSAAGTLLERGVTPGDRVALALGPGAELVAALHGCLLIGAVAIPVDLRLGPAERAARADGAVTIVDDALSGPAADAASLGADAASPDADAASLGADAASPDAIATIMHTSGTTAAPRPVALTYGNWLFSALGSAVALGLDPRERWLCPLPLAHVGGLSIPVRSAIYATTVVLHERFDADAVAALLMDARERVTLVSLVPTMLSRLLDAGLRAPATLRWALLGGGPIAPGLLERAGQAGVPVAPTYGMTEACSQIATHGWPLAGVELRIAPEGEVLVRGPTVAPGALAPDGWLHTGDLGSLDERGRVTITGRRADTIVTGGDNVAPAEVEAVLLEHPAVADAAVFGRPDADWGERLVATVVLRDGADTSPEALRTYCKDRLASFKVPKAVELADGLPRNPSGKVLRRKLR